MRPHAPNQVKELAGTVALVTGGAVRVGRAIALALAEAGADVAIGYHRSSAEARATVSELSARGCRAVAIAADIGKPAEARGLIAKTVARLGRLDVLVNNAAIFTRTPFLATTPAQFDRIIAVNLRGAFFCAQAAARAMGRRGGRIVNIADVGAVRAWPGYIPYGLSKAGIVMLTKGLAAALAPRIQVNAVGPGSSCFPRASRAPRRSGSPRAFRWAAGRARRRRGRRPLLRDLPRVHHGPGPLRGRGRHRDLKPEAWRKALSDLLAGCEFFRSCLVWEPVGEAG